VRYRGVKQTRADLAPCPPLTQSDTVACAILLRPNRVAGVITGPVARRPTEHSLSASKCFKNSIGKCRLCRAHSSHPNRGGSSGQERVVKRMHLRIAIAAGLMSAAVVGVESAMTKPAASKNSEWCAVYRTGNENCY